MIIIYNCGPIITKFKHSKRILSLLFFKYKPVQSPISVT